MRFFRFFIPLAAASVAAMPVLAASSSSWKLVDDFENAKQFDRWQLADTRNDTHPFVANPQVTVRQQEPGGNFFLLKKPAADGIIGNRKALSFIKLPESIALGEAAYTLYVRFNVANFPNNHIFGLSDLDPEGIKKNDYNAFEPSLRITDKRESSGLQNDGTLMVKVDGAYDKIVNPLTGKAAQPLTTDTWYQVWMVINNLPLAKGGQTYDVYLAGGEFKQQQKVYSGAKFRMKREGDLRYFLANCNTGPKDHPYGNGGLRFDDIYIAKGVQLVTP